MPGLGANEDDLLSLCHELAPEVKMTIALRLGT